MLTLPIDVDRCWRVGMVSFVINGGQGWQVFFFAGGGRRKRNNEGRNYW